MSAEKIRQARRLLLEVANDQSCSWCKSHVTLVADACGDLEELARMSDSLRDHPETLRAFRKLGQTAEDLHVLGAIAKVSMLITRFRVILNR